MSAAATNRVPPCTRDGSSSPMSGVLVLERRIGEKIMVGDDIEIVILEVRHRRAKIGILAPAHVPVHRLEVWLERRAGRRRRPR